MNATIAIKIVNFLVKKEFKLCPSLDSFHHYPLRKITKCVLQLPVVRSIMAEVVPSEWWCTVIDLRLFSALINFNFFLFDNPSASFSFLRFLSSCCNKTQIRIQWGSEYQTNSVFEWSKQGRMPNGLVFQWSSRA